MKKLHLIPILILLSVLLPISYTWAQKISVTGTVYEKGIVKVPFNTPKGSIIYYFPDDMTAEETIRGTVVFDPLGKNEKQQKKNLGELMRYTQFLPENMPMTVSYPVTGSRSGNFSLYTGHNNNRPSLRLILKDQNSKVVNEAELPLLNTGTLKFAGTAHDFETPSNHLPTTEQTDKKVYLSGENLLEYVSCSNFYFSQPGKETAMNLIAGSQRKTVLQLPRDVSGPAQIICRDAAGKTIATQNIHVIDLAATCPKTNLLKGDLTEMKVTITGLKGIPAEYLRITLDNTTVNAVQLGQSNHEGIMLVPNTLNYSKFNTDYLFQVKNDKISTYNTNGNFDQFKENIFTLQRTVTALQSGNFSINIGLSYPSSVYNDPFYQQLDAIKTVGQFNNWQNALLNDIKNLNEVTNISMEKITYSGPTPPDPNKWLINDLRRFPDWKPPVTVYAYDTMGNKIKKKDDKQKSLAEPGNLDSAKAMAYSFATGFHFPKEIVEKYFTSTLEAGNAAIQNAMNSAGSSPVNNEVIQTALKYAELRGKFPTNNSLNISTANFSIVEMWKKIKKHFEEENKKIKESDPPAPPAKKFNDPKPIGGAGTQIDDDIPIDMNGVTAGELQVKRIAGRLYTTLKYLMWRIQEDLTNNGGKEGAKLNGQLQLIINEIMSDRR